MFFRCGGLCAILPGGGERVDFLVDFVEVSLMDCEVIWYVGTIGFDFCAILPGGGERVDFLVDFVEVSLMDCEVIWYVGTISFDFAPFFRAVERDWT